MPESDSSASKFDPSNISPDQMAALKKALDDSGSDFSPDALPAVEYLPAANVPIMSTDQTYDSLSALGPDVTPSNGHISSPTGPDQDSKIAYPPSPQSSADVVSTQPEIARDSETQLAQISSNMATELQLGKSSQPHESGSMTAGDQSLMSENIVSGAPAAPTIISSSSHSSQGDPSNKVPYSTRTKTSGATRALYLPPLLHCIKKMMSRCGVMVQFGVYAFVRLCML